MCSFDLAVQGLNVRQDGTKIPITAYTYASPRVGNQAFVDMMKQLEVKVCLKCLIMYQASVTGGSHAIQRLEIVHVNKKWCKWNFSSR